MPVPLFPLSRRSGALAALIAGYLFSTTALAIPPPPAFSFEINTQPNNYLIQGVNQPASVHYFHPFRLLGAAFALDNQNPPAAGVPPGYHTGYINTGFIAPYFTNGRVVQFYDCEIENNPDDFGCDNGMATLGRILMPVIEYDNESSACIRAVLGHELFHHVQFAYANSGGASGCGAFGATPCEGHARAMQDKIYLDLDLTPEAECTAPYLGQVDGYLADTNQRLWSSKYDSALWWTYLMEQYGTVTTEPQRGTDFLARWYIEAVESVDHPNAFLTTDAVIKQTAADDSVVNAFQNFTIANIVKDLDLSNVSAAFRNRYSYRDEDPVPGHTNSQVYGEVIANSLVVPNGGFREAGFGVLQYGAQYTRWNVNNCPTGATLRYEGEPDLSFLPGGFGILADNTSMFSLIAVSGNNPGRPALLYKNRSKGWTIDIPQPLNRYQQIISVVSGRYGDVQGTHRITCDTIARRAELPFASPANPVTPGPDDGPWSFDIALAVPPVTPVAGGANVLFADGSVRFLIDNIELNASAPVYKANFKEFTVTKKTDTGSLPLPDGDYDLTVQVGGIESVIRNGMRLGSARAQILLAIDTSSSMLLPTLAPRLAAVRRAARNLLYALPDGTRFGLIDFAGNNTEPDNDAVLRAQLLPLDDAHRNRVRTALDGLASGPNRFTSIGDALALALQEFSARAEPRQRRHVVLLSDGSENEGARWADVDDAVIAAGVAVHTIAFGPLADQPLLARIAEETGGTFRYVDVGGVPDEAALGDAFAQAVENIERRTRIAQNETISIGANQTETVRVQVPTGLDTRARHRFFAVIDRTNVGVGGIAQVRVFDPTGTELVDGVNGASVRRFGDDVWVDGRIVSGEWSIQISSASTTPGTPAVPMQVFAGVSANAGIAMLASASPQTPRSGATDILVGDGVVVQIALLLPAVQKVREAAARMRHPDGAIEKLILNDDGERGDAVAGDRVWSGTYRRITQGSPTGFPDDASQSGVRGSYRAAFEVQFVDSSATTTQGGAPTDSLSLNFTKIEFATRRTTTTPDTDADLMPDRYESAQSCLNPALPDGSMDADSDGRASFLEYQSGTDPCDADTDGGGETDGSEHARGANAHDAGDDALPPIGFAQVESPDSEHMESTPVPPDAIPIRYAAHPSYAAIALQRATAANGPFVEVATIDPSSTPGVYLDTGLVSGQRYWYRMQPRTANARQGVFGPIFSGVAWSDPRATMGSMVIHNGRPRTDNLTIGVQQSLYQKPWPTSNFRFKLGDLPASAWQPFVPNFNIALTPVAAPTVRHLAVRFRDIEGQESIDYHDNITQHPAGSLGGARVRVFSASLFGAASGGALVRIVASEIEPVAISDSSGNALLDELLPGSYTIEINVPGLPSVFRNVVIVAGQVVDLGDVSVAPPTDALFANGFE